MTTKKTKSWTDKFHNGKAPKVEVLESGFADMQAGERMLVANPEIFDAYIRQIPEGSSVDLKTMRRDLAADFQADNTCPLTSGIFMRIVMERAYEQLQGGASAENITPFWRVRLDPKSGLWKKLSFPAAFILEKRRQEGLA